MNKIKYIILDVPLICIDDELIEIWSEIVSDDLIEMVYNSIKYKSYLKLKFNNDLISFLENIIDQVGDNLVPLLVPYIFEFRAELKRSLDNLDLALDNFHFGKMFGDHTLLLHRPDRNDV